MTLAIITSIAIVFTFFLVLGLVRMAAPATEEERRLDDEAQKEFIEDYMRRRLNKTRL